MKRRLLLKKEAKKGADYVVDWVKRVAQGSMRSESPSAIIVPHQEVGIWLRRILATQSGPFMNIHFWTPEHLRSHLLRLELRVPDFPRKLAIASREELQVILSSTAGALATEKSEKALFMRAIEVDPASLLRVLDMLDSANLKPQMFKILEEVADLAEAFYSAVEKQGLRTVNAMDRLLASRPKMAATFDSLLLFGFHAGHWPLFPLLNAASRTAENLTLLFDAPRDASFDLDTGWIGTWEELFALEALPLEDEENEGEEAQEPCVEFLAEESTRDLARAIALRAAKMLLEGAKSIAIVFSAYGVLSREVALILKELEIPHYDAIGHTFLESTPLWRSWCAFQKNRTIQAFSHFLTLFSPREAEPITDSCCITAIRLLQEATAEALSTDFFICREFACVHGDKKNEEARKFLMACALLPEEASFAKFCDIVEEEFSRFGWEEQVECLRKRREPFRESSVLFVQQDVFLRWLEGALCEKHRVRDPMGSHFYAAIQLLRREEAAVCSWTHVLLAGMNAGEWPETLEESGFFSGDAIVRFNVQITAANHNARIQGAFGEGHLAVTCIPCLGPHERLLLQRRDFQSLRQTSHLVATTQLKNDSGAFPNRPSLWFSELFSELHATPPSLDDLRALIPPRDPQAPPLQIKEIATARNIRLNPGTPFGAWEFACSLPPSSPPSLSVREVERIFREPAIVWMETFLGVEAPENEFSCALTVGTWIHRWLKNIVCYPWEAFPDPASRREAISSASEATRATMESICRSLQRQAPPWWVALWEQARTFAFQFSDQLEAFQSSFSFLATETSFRDIHIAPLRFPLRGRWDLLLCDQITSEGKPGPQSGLLIIDYKLGQQDLKLSSLLRDGTGIQLALYSYAALACWEAKRIDAAWITPQTAGNLVQLPFEELEKINPILLALDRMVCHGVFGMRGELRSEFTFQKRMPLATLSIPPDVLKSKWMLTHEVFGGSSTNLMNILQPARRRKGSF